MKKVFQPLERVKNKKKQKDQATKIRNRKFQHT